MYFFLLALTFAERRQEHRASGSSPRSSLGAPAAELQQSPTWHLTEQTQVTRTGGNTQRQLQKPGQSFPPGPVQPHRARPQGWTETGQHGAQPAAAPGDGSCPGTRGPTEHRSDGRVTMTGETT